MIEDIPDVEVISSDDEEIITDEIIEEEQQIDDAQEWIEVLCEDMPIVNEDFYSLAIENLKNARNLRIILQNCGLQHYLTFIDGHPVKVVFLPVKELLVIMVEVEPSPEKFVNMLVSLKKKPIT